MTAPLYDAIGRGYAARRSADPRIAAAIVAALGDAASVVNVGAGTGSYEPAERTVVAVEPSETMIGQRAPGAAPCVRAVAEALPFADGAFDAAMAVLTLHHWRDVDRGLAELRRVARGPVVLLTWVPDGYGRPWIHDYFPELAALDAGFPAEAALRAQLEPLLGPATIAPVPIPADCADGFLAAYWRRPEAYLDPDVRAAISSFHHFDPHRGLASLARDLADGRWARRHADLLARDALDCGYRLLRCAPR